MTTEDGDIDPADQHSSRPRFCSGETSGGGEPEITSTAGDNQHLHKGVKKGKPSPSLPLTHFLHSRALLTSQPLTHF